MQLPVTCPCISGVARAAACRMVRPAEAESLWARIRLSTGPGRDLKGPNSSCNFKLKAGWYHVLLVLVVLTYVLSRLHIVLLLVLVLP